MRPSDTLLYSGILLLSDVHFFTILMCTVCGLPTTHSNLATALGTASVISFGILTFASAWWIVKTSSIRSLWKRCNKK